MIWRVVVGNLVIVVVALLLSIYGVWAGVGNFLGVQNQSLQLGLDLTVVGWASIITLVMLPAVMFLVCVAVIIVIAIRTRALRVRAALFVFALGFAIVSVVTLDIVLALPQTAIYAT